MFDKYPDANYGIATGAASGLVAIDVDPRHNGHVALEACQDRYGKMPSTLTQTTGGGGFHHLFRHPGVRVGNGTNIVPGVDARGDGGYIVGPGSNHASGGVYDWYDGEPGEVEIAELPPWVFDLIDSKPRGGSGSDAIHDADIRAAAKLLRFDGDAEAPAEVRALADNDPLFGRTWRGDRPEFDYPDRRDTSRYTHSIVSRLLSLGLPEQAIQNAVTEWYSTHEPDKLKSHALRRDFVARSIVGIRASRNGSLKGKRSSGLQALPQTDINTTDPLAFLKERLFPEFAGFEQYGTEEFGLRLADGRRITVGTARALLDYKGVRDAAYEATGHVILRMVDKKTRRDDWPLVAETLWSIRKTIDTPELTPIGRLRAYLEQYIDEYPPAGRQGGHWEYALREKLPFARDGALWINAPHFRRYITQSICDRIENRELLALLRVGDATRRTASARIEVGAGGKTTMVAAKYWIIPPETFDPERQGDTPK